MTRAAATRLNECESASGDVASWLGARPSEWLRSYVGTYVERDVRAIRNVGDLSAFQRFLGLCAGRSGQLLNYSSLADDCGISQPSARSWFSFLEASFIAFHLPVFSGKVRKRLVKMPKLIFYDTGLACWLLAGCWASGRRNSSWRILCAVSCSRPGCFRKC